MRSTTFDLSFVYLFPAIGIALASIAVFFPSTFGTILAFNILFLSNHHVIATYMRLAYDVDQEQHKFLMIYSPLLLTIGVGLIVGFGFISLLFTIFVHWQWFHYGKQSEGIAKTFSIKYKSSESGPIWFNRTIFYMTPVVTFLVMCSRPGRTFLGKKVFLLPVSPESMMILGTLSALLFSIWIFLQARAWMKGNLASLHFGYLLSHHVIYFVGYVLFKDLTTSWIALSIWHNTQYISLVWHFNTNQVQRYSGKFGKFLTLLAQPKYAALYMLVGVAVSFLFYRSIGFVSRLGSPMIGFPLFFIANQIVIYHHYVVDAYIWKLRKPEIKASLGIAGPA